MKRMTEQADRIDKSVAIDSEGNIETAKDVAIDGDLRLNGCTTDINPDGRMTTRYGKIYGKRGTTIAEGVVAGFPYLDQGGNVVSTGFAFKGSYYNRDSTDEYQSHLVGIATARPGSHKIGFISVCPHVWQHMFYATNPSLVTGLTRLYGEVITTYAYMMTNLSQLTLSDFATSTNKSIERVPLHGSFTKNEKTYEIIQGYRVSKADFRYGLLGIADNGETAELIIDEDTAEKVLLNDTTRDF